MLDKLIITKTLRVPSTPELVAAESSDQSAAVARQMDVVLVRAGFKATGPLLAHISALTPEAAMDRAVLAIGAVRELVGDDVAHNAYFIDFPRNVPDTMEFWIECLRDALVGSTTAGRVGAAGGAPTDAELMDFVHSGALNLLTLPKYGRYQHTYAELLDAHLELIPSAKDRVTVVHLGDTVEREAQELYRALAESAVPLGEAGLVDLAALASACLDGAQPESIPVRENRAVLNTVRLEAGKELVGINTVTDVLRLACRVSGGDVTLRTATVFATFTWPQRRVLMAALNSVIEQNPAKLGDVAKYARRWQRLGERIHPGSDRFAGYPAAREVFSVARGNQAAQSLSSRIERAFADGDVALAADRLTAAPGMLARSVDRLLRTADSQSEVTSVVAGLESVADRVAARVLLSLREHLDNRQTSGFPRVFANRGRRAWVTEDTRPPLDVGVTSRIAAVIDEEILRRLPDCDMLVLDEQLLGVALPLSGNASEDGFGVLPRGSVMPVDNETLRLFCYWRESSERTDYDLSALFLNNGFEHIGQVSYTNYHFGDVVHSGDITHSANGATEFIDVPLPGLAASYIVPQVNIYSGEGFDEVDEAMFGFMTRETFQEGAPFEARTVRMRSAMRGAGRVALPLAFQQGDDGVWLAKWMQLNMPGHAAFNQIEGNRLTTGLVARSILLRQYLNVEYLVRLWSRKIKSLALLGPDLEINEPITYLGLQEPEVPLPEGSTVITAATLNRLIPE